MKRKPVNEWSEKTDMTCLIDWAEAYMDTVKVRFSDETYTEKRTMFKHFFKVIDPETPVSKLTPAMVMDHIVKQSQERGGNCANKDRKNLVAGWNWGMKYLTPVLPAPNPCLVEKMPEKRYPRYVPSEQDFWKVYKVAEGQDKLMLSAFLHLGARRGEIFRMKWDDVDFPSSRVRLWTKKRTDGTLEFDWLPITQELRKMLLGWWESRPVKESPFVFVCLNEGNFCQPHYGKPFTSRQHFMEKLCEKAGVKPFGFHGIRHLTASTLYKLGYEVAVIQIVLRHQSPSTTERYLRRIGLERVRDALENIAEAEEAEVIAISEMAKKRNGNVI
ncbi:MAG: tyrosine-type recombinase/integrase [Desulfobacterales bacterium]|nr:tyrosine-type recombinase/integrase [Desulfobacterales bacterium]